MMKQTDAAKADFERALKADPCFWEARYNLKRLGFEATNAAGCRYTPWQQQSLDEIK
jgi:Tfp pilus assembly protein PilF